MLERIGKAVMVLLVSIDQLFAVLLAIPGYLIVGGDVPNPDETISSKVGRFSNMGYKWAKVCEFGIDLLFRALGGKPRHCQRMIERACNTY